MGISARWEALRKEARQLENEIDLQLVTFSKLGTGVNFMTSSNGSSTCEQIASDLELMLNKLSDVNAAMGDEVNSFASASTNASVTHTLQRHQDILQNYRQEFSKMRANVRASRAREDLLGSVRRDISAHKNGPGFNHRTELYMQENEKLRSSSRLADDALGMAMAAEDSLRGQRRILGNTQSHLTDLLQRYPTVNNIISRIDLRKRRDSIILGAVISLCVIILFLYSRA